MLGALCAISLYHLYPSLPLAFAGGVALVTVVGLLLERLASGRPGTSLPSPSSSSRGRAVFIKGLAMILWARRPTPYPLYGQHALHLGPAT